MCKLSVSVIIPTFRRIPMLRRALRGVSEQSYRPEEVLVIVSDPDEYDEIIRLDEVAKNNTVRVISCSKRLKGGEARNVGIKNASGEIIFFLDDDDHWLPKKIERHLAVHSVNRRIGVVYSGAIVRHESGKRKDTFAFGRPVPENVVTAMSEGSFAPYTASAVSARKSCLDAVDGFDPELSSFQDWDLWLRMAMNEVEFHSIHEPLIIYTLHGGFSVSRDASTRLHGLRQVHEKYMNKLEMDKFYRKHVSLIAYAELSDIVRRRDVLYFAKTYFNCVRTGRIDPLGVLSIKIFAKLVFSAFRPQHVHPYD
ncbi:glycosyltransferase family 2 protein [Mesorhizobium sp.]|uniref:glycosyltransferase family A protein n=1 Tax=Mesorhizobium sp. TaxID=1871066 RepID=UPI000FE94A78|nr:glycosyltransferase family 2 protein [Mesorhizobium sp.]RWP73314.1 MAG: glycosyltransferase family 2 protein [Mesorhizobium sp.]